MREWSGFRDGEVYHNTFVAPEGPIAIEADLSLERDAVVLRNLILEPLGARYLQVGTRAMLQIMRSLLNAVRDQGYTYLQIEGVRTTGANPQRVIRIRRKA